jgi:hypothetical protein
VGSQAARTAYKTMPGMAARTVSRHPEAAAKRPSKGDGPDAPAASFEARGACHRAGHFGPGPLARTSG